MKREMVEVKLYEDGEYTVEDIESDCITQRLWGMESGRTCDIYYCLKKNWKKYLLRLLSVSDIDKQIAELKRNRRKKLKLKEQISREIEREGRNDTEKSR